MDSISFKVVDFGIQLAVILFAISFHESAHAYSAFKLGDPTAKDLGRMLELCGSGIRTASEIRDSIDEPVATVFEALLENGILEAGPQPPSHLPMASGPGVTRLQHAGLLFRGREAGIISNQRRRQTKSGD